MALLLIVGYVTHFSTQLDPLVVVQNPSTRKMMAVLSSDVTRLTMAMMEANLI